MEPQRWVIGIILTLMASAGAQAQDVFLGGSFDFEARTGGATTATFSRAAGVNLTFVREGELEVFFDFNLAGGRGRTIQFYVTFPQLAKGMEVALGRRMVPFGLPEQDPIDRYVAGAPDIFDPFAKFRRGNIFLDTFGDGVFFAWGKNWARVEAAWVDGPGDSRWNLFLRGSREWGSWRLGLSLFKGEDVQRTKVRFWGPHLHWQPRATTALSAETFWGRLRGTDVKSTFLSLQHRFPNRPVETFLSLGALDREAGASLTTTRLGGRYWLNPFSFVEARYEFNDAPAPDDDDLLVLRYRADF